MTVFFFTAIEDATALWERYPWEMGEVLTRHDAFFKEHIPHYGGKVLKCTGTGIYAAFEGGDPLECALEAQRWLTGQGWGAVRDLRVCIALHAGDAERVGAEYVGPAVERTLRVLEVGWGGQILLTPAALQRCALPAGARAVDLGVQPLRDLYKPQPLYLLSHADLPGEWPPVRSLAAYTHNLPFQNTPFVVRPELEGLRQLLNDPQCRLITLVGPGGIGKTRLALQSAATCVESFAHGVYFVALTSVSNPNLVVTAIGAAMKFLFYGQEDPREQLLEYLRDKQRLLVLDTFEHLIVTTPLIAEILERAPGVRLLVTSRVRLGLPMERVLRVDGLEVPALHPVAEWSQYSALAFFVQSARRVTPDFAVSEADGPAIARICRVLGGNPLAIELAAVWTRHLSCEEIAVEIEQGLDFLESTARDVPERHRSLRAVFDYSWRLLSAAEQQALCALAVFSGGFEAIAAAQVAGVLPDVLAALSDKSWVRREASGRYVFQEALREYAEEKLQQTPARETEIRDRHCAYYAGYVHARETASKGPEMLALLNEIEITVENIYAAWQWAIEGAKVAELCLMLEGFYWYSYVRGLYQEAEASLGAAIQCVRDLDSVADPETRLLLGRLLGRRGWLCLLLSRYKEAQALLEESLALLLPLDHLSETAFTLNALGYVVYSVGEVSKARAWFEESLRLYEESGDRWGMARVYTNLGSVLKSQGLYKESLRFAEQGLTLFKEVGDPLGVALASNNLAGLIYESGDYPAALRLYNDALAIQKKLNNPRGVAMALHSLGALTFAMQEYEMAQSYYERSLAMYREMGHRWGVASILAQLGELAFAQRAYEASETYFKESLALAEAVENQYGIASALAGLGDAYFIKQQYRIARQHYQHALRIASANQLVDATLSTLFRVGRLVAQEGRAEEALSLLWFCAPQLLDPVSRASAEALIGELTTALPDTAQAEIRQRMAGMSLADFVALVLG